MHACIPLGVLIRSLRLPPLIQRGMRKELYVPIDDDNELVLVFYIHTDATKHAYTCLVRGLETPCVYNRRFLSLSIGAKTRRSVAGARVTGQAVRASPACAETFATC